MKIMDVFYCVNDGMQLLKAVSSSPLTKKKNIYIFFPDMPYKFFSLKLIL